MHFSAQVKTDEKQPMVQNNEVKDLLFKAVGLMCDGNPSFKAELLAVLQAPNTDEQSTEHTA